MAEINIFTLAGKILSALSPIIIDQIGLPWYAKEELKKLEKTISTIRNVLLHAQEVQNSNDAVKGWLKRLKRVLYEAEDLFDEVALQLQEEIVFKKSITGKVKQFFTSSNPLLFHYNLGGKIKDIRERLDEICTDMREFGFLVQSLDNQIFRRTEIDVDFRQTVPLMNIQNITGREDDKKKLLHLLLSSPNDENVHVISIVGMGGMGKTILAKMIFHENTLTAHFDKKLWVYVSENFNLERILKNILIADGENIVTTGIVQLLNIFQERLSGKKLFLVLDDVWNDDPVKWKKLEVLLVTVAHGSRILVTTRDKKVAKIVSTVEPYQLNGLPEEDLLSILIKWAFEKGNEANHPELVEIGRKIVKKCCGVPLAARTLGVSLYLKISQKEWMLVRDSQIWSKVQNKDSVISSLKLSYDRMTPSLRECFCYCALFKKDERIPKEKLIYHWIAHGLIQSSDRTIDLEEISEAYLDELVGRSFLECKSSNSAYENDDLVYYKVHDLIHELATCLAGKEILRVEGQIISEKLDKVRHVSTNRSSYISKIFLEGKNLKTIYTWTELYHQEEVLHLRSRYLRVLDYVFANELGDVTKSIKKMKYLRYLSIVDLETIPESLCELLNLQYLVLSWASFDTIPENFGKLRNLRVLKIESSYNLNCLPEGIRSLTSLRKFKIYFCPGFRSLGAGFGGITSLQHLEIIYCKALEFSNSDFRGLTSLKVLVLKGLSLKQLPMGLKDVAATLKHLEIQSCHNLTLSEQVLPNLSSLEVVEIGYCPMITCLPEGIRSLTSLRKLKISSCENLRSLGNGLGSITSLEHLDLYDCPSLQFSNSDFQGLTNTSLKSFERNN